MAHLQKYKMAAVHGMMHHYERDREGVLERENIDRERTHLNYNLGDGDVLRAIQEAVESHNEHGRNLRVDSVVMADWVVTAPRDLEQEREREFFATTYRFIQERYGEDNVPLAYVHMDEQTPHMHCPVIPLSDEGRLQASLIIDRNDLRTFHQDLSRTIEQEMGRSYEIMLDQERAAERELSRLPQSQYVEAKQVLEQTQQAQEQAQQQLEQARAEQEQAQAQARDAELREQQSEARLESLRRLERSCEQGPVAIAQERVGLAREDRELGGRAEELECGRDEAAARVAELEQQRDAARDRVEELEQQREAARERVSALERTLCAARERVEVLRESLSQARDRARDLIDKLRERIQDPVRTRDRLHELRVPRDLIPKGLVREATEERERRQAEHQRVSGRIQHGQEQERANPRDLERMAERSVAARMRDADLAARDLYQQRSRDDIHHDRGAR